MSSPVKLDIKQLEALKTVLSSSAGWTVKVGVLGNKAQRTATDGDSKTNPEIGLEHEFGVISKRLPARSFLRMPLMTRLQLKIQEIGQGVWISIILSLGKSDARSVGKSGAGGDSRIRASIKSGVKGMDLALQTLGVVGENIVQEAFETGGFGQWPKLSPYTIRKKGSSAILIDTAQLRKSITSAVQKP